MDGCVTANPQPSLSSVGTGSARARETQGGADKPAIKKEGVDRHPNSLWAWRAALGERVAHATVRGVPTRPTLIPHPKPGGRWGAGSLPKPLCRAPSARQEREEEEEEEEEEEVH